MAGNGHQKREGMVDGGWGDYMREKKRKLRHQQAEIHTTSAQKSAIFTGVAIFINGYTDPSASVLRQLIMLHGGDFHAYREDGTTHTIASNLPHSKIAQLKPGEKVVRTEWITDSVAAGRLLPDIDYLLYGKKQNCGAISKFVEKSNDQQEPDNAKSEIRAGPSRCAGNATDDDFVANFYARSRLHFISTWAQKMKQFVAQIRESKDDATLEGLSRLTKYVAASGTGTHSPKTSPRRDSDTNVYMHIDMDCFFVSVALLSRPELRAKPVAVTHASQPQRGDKQSMAEIASCSYEARAAGVANGMLVGKALRRCPNLEVVPYDFEEYDRVSKTLYSIVTSYTLDVEAVSCDELYVRLGDVCAATGAAPEQVAGCIREHVREQTGCPASAGIGGNMLLARLATRHAKPDGIYFVQSDNVARFMVDERACDLPGVGYSTMEKLTKLCSAAADCERNELICGELQSVPLQSLVDALGTKAGRTVFDACRGRCGRQFGVVAQRKTVSCDINFGIRLKTVGDADKFLEQLSNEVSSRLAAINVHGHTVTLRLLIRAPHAPVEPAKYMGCGECVAWSRAVTLPQPAGDAARIAEEAKLLWRAGRPVVEDVRGIGISISRLVPDTGQANAAAGTRRLDEFFRVDAEKPGTSAASIDSRPLNTSPQKRIDQGLRLAPVSPVETQIDPDVLAALPEDIRAEVLRQYGRRDGVSVASTAGARGSSRSRHQRGKRSPRRGKRRPAARKDGPSRGSGCLPRDDVTLPQFFGHSKRSQTPISSVIKSGKENRAAKGRESAMDSRNQSPVFDMDSLYGNLIKLLEADDETAMCAVSRFWSDRRELRGRLSTLSIMFRKLYREAEKKIGSIDALQRYNSLLGMFQAGIVASFGAPLARIPRFDI